MNRFIVITGPTATGKTAISALVAKGLSSQVICADSAQIYRGMDIGTAKATKEEMRGVKHHMINVADPDEDYSVARFQREAFRIIDSLNEKGITPVVSGGTGLYINSLVYELDFASVKKNEAIRQKYAQLADDKSVLYLYNILKEKDPNFANIISANDKKRIIRRLEVLEAGAAADYDFRVRNERYEYLMIGLSMPRSELYRRIDERVDSMVEKGLVGEAKDLYERYAEANALKAIGYKEIITYLKGVYDLKEAVRLIKRNTRRFAKRQITWFKKDERIKWYDVSGYTCIDTVANDIIRYIKGKGF